jgi:hypothetical protein
MSNIKTDITKNNLLDDSDDDIIYSDDMENDIYSTESIANKYGKEFTPRDFFTAKELCYYTMADIYFKTKCSKDNIELMIKIIESNHDISLRILDWFVSKFSKYRNKINFNINDEEEFDIRISYDAQLKTYRKKNFDPFRRKKKFYYFYDDENKSSKIFTTIGQLNFFKWVITTKILDFVKDNINEINDEMKKYIISDRKKKKEKAKKKKQVKKPIIKKINNNNTTETDEIVLHFM